MGRGGRGEEEGTCSWSPAGSTQEALPGVAEEGLRHRPGFCASGLSGAGQLQGWFPWQGAAQRRPPYFQGFFPSDLELDLGGARWLPGQTLQAEVRWNTSDVVNAAQVAATCPEAETRDLCACPGGGLATPYSCDPGHWNIAISITFLQKEAKIEGTHSYIPKYAQRETPLWPWPIGLGLGSHILQVQSTVSRMCIYQEC